MINFGGGMLRDMTYDLTQVFIAFMGVILAILTSVVFPWIKSKTTSSQQDTIRKLATMAVYAAQQVLGDNTAKRAYAFTFMSEMLEKYSIELSADEISTYIEGVLKDIKTNLSDGADW